MNQSIESISVLELENVSNISGSNSGGNPSSGRVSKHYHCNYYYYLNDQQKSGPKSEEKVHDISSHNISALFAYRQPPWLPWEVWTAAPGPPKTRHAERPGPRKSGTPNARDAENPGPRKLGYFNLIWRRQCYG